MASPTYTVQLPIPNDVFQSPFPPPPPFSPPPPPKPPATPAFRQTDQYFTLLQEFVLPGTTTYNDAADRCRPLAASIHPAFESGATALVDSAGCPDGFMVISCGYTAPREVILQFNEWVDTSPLPSNPNACVPMAAVRTGIQEVQWSNDDLRGDEHHADHQNMPCGQFYSAICSSDSDTLLQLVDLPPSTPPPPMAPDADLAELTVVDVVGKGGVRGDAQPLARCTDSAETECVAESLEQPWLMFALSAQHSRIYSARLFFMPPAPPTPPQPPPPQSPPALPAGSEAAAEATGVSSVVVEPTGAVGDGTNVRCDAVMEAGKVHSSNGGALSARQVDEPDALVCEHDCVRNPVCNAWSWRQVSDVSGECLLFNSVTDYTDAPAGESWVSGSCDPSRNPTGHHLPGTLELYVSRSLALFGTRAAVIDTTQVAGGEVTVRLTEDGDMAEGRYIYLRSFDSNRQLRIDGVKFFVSPDSTRRLGEAPSDPTKPAKHAKGHEHAAKAHIPVIPEHAWVRIYKMRNLTATVCLNETNAPVMAKEARHAAAMLWADMAEHESLVGCIDCVMHTPSNCTKWFERPHGMRGAHTETLQKKRRQMKEQLDRDEPERVRRLEEAVGSSCCKTDRRTGKKECGKQHCAKAFKQKAGERMAQTLRIMHHKPEVKHVQLSVAQLVSTDMVAPHLHHNDNCMTEAARDKTGHAECIASSLLKHLGDKHGFSEVEINKKMERFGLTVADMVTAQLRHSVSSSTGGKGGKAAKQKYQSDPVAADKASAHRRSEVARRKLGVAHAQPVQPVVRKAPRASWLKRSTRRGRRLAEAEADQAPGVERLALSPKDLRLRKKDHDQFVRNQTLAAKAILQAGNLAVASHGAQPITVTNLVGAAWDASLAADGSLLGRVRTVAGAAGRIGQKLSHMGELVATARGASPPPPPRKRRKLTAKEEAYFDRVDKMVGSKDRGFKVPDRIEEQYGWVSDALDWSYWYEEAHRVGRILYNRHDWVHQHAEDTGTLPVGELPVEHKTGYSMLDVNAPPTYIGSWIRSKFTGGERHASHRKLQEKRALHSLPRAEPPEGVERKSVLGAFMDAAVGDRDPLDAAWDALHYNQHQHQNVRHLVELGQWVSQETVDTAAGYATDYGERLAPVLFGEGTGSVPNAVSSQGEEGIDPLRQVGRFIAYDTLMCYLYPPPSLAGGPMGDGTPVVLHYSNRACFPMIPYLPPDQPTFNEAFNLGEDFEWSSLEYDQQCDSATVKALIGPMMGDLSGVGFIAAPYGSLLRFAEGIDSIRNLARTGDSTLTNSERGSAIVCSIAQLGGLIWMAVTILFLAVFCVCAPVGSWCCLRGYRICRGAGRREQRREEAIDDLLSQQYGQYGIDARIAGASNKASRGVSRARVGPLGHVLVGTVEEA